MYKFFIEKKKEKNVIIVHCNRSYSTEEKKHNNDKNKTKQNVFFPKVYCVFFFADLIKML